MVTCLPISLIYCEEHLFIHGDPEPGGGIAIPEVESEPEPDGERWFLDTVWEPVQRFGWSTHGGIAGADAGNLWGPASLKRKSA